jgi:hypothetical protein
LKQREFGGELIDVQGAVDLHCHPFPDLFPRVADDVEIVIAARDAGLKAIMLKCHNESTVSRAYFMNRMVPGIRVYGGIVLNRYVGSINPAAVEAALRLGGKAVWMPTIDAGYHGQMYGDTGGYDALQGGLGGEGIWITDEAGRLKPEVEDVCKLVAEHSAILNTAHISPKEIVALLTRARELGVEKICITHPFDKAPNLDLPTLEEVVRLGGMPEFGYCTVSPSWRFATPDKIVEAISRVGASRCLLVSDTGQRHNPLPSEALRLFAQTLFEKGVGRDDVYTMIARNPADLLDYDSTPKPTPDQAATWERALGNLENTHLNHEHDHGDDHNG